MKNISIRTACVTAGIKHWQLAEALGITESHFSRKLRNELSDEEQQKIMEVIDRLSAEKKEVV